MTQKFHFASFIYLLMSQCRLFKVGLLSVAFALTGLQFAARSDASAVPGIQRTGLDAWQGSSSQLTADFDGDKIPDLAIGRTDGQGYTVRIQFTTNLPATSLILPAGGPGVSIFSRDVDNDSHPDLIVTSAASRFPIAVWLSEGNGHFHAANHWSYFPSQFGGPHNLGPLQSPESVAGVSEDDRFTGSQPDIDPALTGLQACDWVAPRPARFLPSDLVIQLSTRGPPSAA